MTDDTTATLLADTREFCEIVTSTLGPFGATKLIVQDNGTVTMTASGSEVLDRCDLDEPAVELLRTAAAGFRTEHRDGTSTLVALVGSLLAEATDLRELGLHPTTIERGFRTALESAREALASQALPVEEVGTEAVARTALTGVQDPQVQAGLSREIAQIGETLWQESPDEPFDRRNLAVVSRVGGALSETDLVPGVVLDDSPVLESMPRSANGGIALLSSSIDVQRPGGEMGRRPGLTLTLSPDSFDDRRVFDEAEKEQFDQQVAQAVDAGCSVVFTTASVNDRVKRTLAENGLIAVQRIDEDDLRRLARGTGATVLGSFADIEPAALGTGSVSVERAAGKDMTIVETSIERVYTLFCRAPDPRTLDAFSTSVESAVAAVTVANRSGSVVPAGGASEMGAAEAVRREARQIDSREQLAAEAFGRALTVIPRTLARTAGLDGTDAVIELQNRYAERPATMTAGVDVFAGEVCEVVDTGEPLVEPHDTKLAIWESAVDLAVQLLRIDERLPASDLGTGQERDPERERELASPGHDES